MEDDIMGGLGGEGIEEIPDVPEDDFKTSEGRGTRTEDDEEDTDAGFSGLQRQSTLAALNEMKDLAAEQLARIFDVFLRKYKIMASFYQLVTVIPRSYPVSFGEPFTGITSSFNFVNLDVKDFVPFKCVSPGSSYYDKYLMKAFFVLFLSFMVFVLCQNFYPLGILSEHKENTLISVYFIFIFTIYPSISAQSGETFKCLETADLEMTQMGRNARYLKADLKIDCDSDSHVAFQALDAICILIFPIGIPVMWALSLWPHVEKLKNREDPRKIPEELGHLAVLVSQYEPEYWWFELAECGRKWLLVSGCLLSFTAWDKDGIEYPSSQILMAILVCTFAIALFTYTAPFIYDLDDIFAYASLFTLWFIYTMAAYKRFDTLLNELGYEHAEVAGASGLILFTTLLVLCVMILGIVFFFIDLYIGEQGLQEYCVCIDSKTSSGFDYSDGDPGNQGNKDQVEMAAQDNKAKPAGDQGLNYRRNQSIL